MRRLGEGWLRREEVRLEQSSQPREGEREREREGLKSQRKELMIH